MPVYILTELDLDGMPSKKVIGTDLKKLLAESSEDLLHSEEAFLKIQKKLSDVPSGFAIKNVSDFVYIERICPEYFENTELEYIDTEEYFIYGEEEII